MRVFLTGGTGFLGSYIALALADAGHEVVIPTRRLHETATFPARHGVQFFAGDLRNVGEWTDSLAQCDALIHHAMVWNDEETGSEINDLGAFMTLLAVAGDAGIKHVVYTSSTAVHRPFQGTMTEQDRLRPTDEYSASKICSEDLLRQVADTLGFPSTILRLAPAIGAPAWAGAKPSLHRSIQDIVDKVIAGQDVQVTKGEGRQFLHAPDYGRICRQVVEQGIEGTVLCAAEEITTWQEIANLAIQRTRSSSNVVALEPPDETPPPRFDLSRFAAAFGWRPTTQGSWDQALSAYTTLG